VNDASWHDVERALRGELPLEAVPDALREDLAGALEVERLLLGHARGDGVEPAAAPGCLGPYRLRRLLGRGGQGSIWLADDTRLPRQVALKVLDAGLAWSPARLQRLQREAAILARLEHPGLCTVFESGIWQGQPYFAMRLVDGESLAEVVARGPVEWRRATGWIEQAARALAVAHAAGIVHRDIKPANLMCTRDDRIVVVDFGLARDLAQTATPRAGAPFGTPAYLAPEAISARFGEPDGRADLFALAVVLHELIAGVRPFAAPTAEGVLHAVLTEAPRDLRADVPTVPAELAELLQAALRRAPAERPRDAAAFAAALARVRAGAWARSGRRAFSHARARRRTWTWLALALAGAIACLGAAWLWWREHHARLGAEAHCELALAQLAAPQAPAVALTRALAVVPQVASPTADAAVLAILAHLERRVAVAAPGVSVAVAADGAVVELGFTGAAVRLATLSLCGGVLATAAGDGVVRAWSLRDQRELLFAALDSAPTWLAIAHNRSALAVADGQGGIRLLPLQAEVASLRLTMPRRSARVELAFSPDSRWLAACSERGDALLFDARSGDVVFELAGSAGATPATPRAVFAADGRELTTVLPGAEQTLIAVWDLARGGCRAVLDARCGAVATLALSRSGQLLAIGEDGRAALFAPSGACVRRWRGDVTAAAFAPRGDQLALAYRDGRIELLALYGEAAPRQLARDAATTTLRFSPDGARLLALAAPRAQVWSVESAELLVDRPSSDANLLLATASADALVSVAPRGVSVAPLDAVAAARALSR
jgi:hypothetical protein